MLVEAINRILGLAAPNFHTVGNLEYSDKKMNLIAPPVPDCVACSTLQGLVDLYEGELDDAKTKGDLLVHITCPTDVEVISRKSDEFGQRRVWAHALFPKCDGFPFGGWLNPENFIIAAQQHFQRVKIENDDGSFMKDLEYVLGVASKITAENVQSHDDDGFAQRVATKSGVVLKAETVLRPVVVLAPYRTFAEIDQVPSQFVFRARIGGDSIQLALFEGDGGRWKLAATASIAAWLAAKFGDVPVIS